MDKEQEIKQLIKFLLDDAESQVNALKHRNDVAWDCYSIDNWKNTASMLKKVQKYIDTKRKD